MADGKPIMTEREEIHQVWNAVDSLREDVGHIKTSQAAVSVKLDALHSALTATAETSRSAVERINESSKTPWGLIIGACGFLMTLGGSLVVGALAPLYLMDSVHTAEIAEHSELHGHPEALQLSVGLARDISRLDGNVQETRQSVKDLDTALQREMRDLDKTQIERLNSWDTTLQREMRMLQDVADADRLGLKDEVAAIRSTIQRINAELDSVRGTRYTNEMARDDSTRTVEWLFNLAQRISKLELKEKPRTN